MQLYRVLHAYVAANPRQGYCQGFNMIAALILFYVPEEDAFFCFDHVMHKRYAKCNNELRLAQSESVVLERLL